MEKQNCSVKDMLAQGIDPNDLMKSLADEINSAIEELNAEAENQEVSTLDAAREEAAQAFYNYLIALDVIPAEVAEEMDAAEITELLKSMEDQIKAYAAIASLAAGLGIEPKPVSRGKRAMAHPVGVDSDIDDAKIKAFLQSLR